METMDIHKNFINKNATESQLVSVGRWSTFIIVIGTLSALILLRWQGGIFIYIQDMAAFFAPPISVIFLAAFLWPRVHGRSATFTLLFGIVAGLCLKIFAETWGEDGIESLKPLLNRAAVTWALCLIALIASTLIIRRNPGGHYDPDAIWTLKWARLPQSEKHLNRAPRNLLFWWIVMISVSTSLFVIFR